MLLQNNIADLHNKSEIAETHGAGPLVDEKRDIRSLRLAKGISQKDLAKFASVSQTELSKCERGLVLPDEEFFASVATVLEVSVECLRETHSKLLDSPVYGEGYKTAKPEADYVIHRRADLDKSAISIVDLFCGVGGFSHGFEKTEAFQVTVGVDLLPDRAKTFSDNHRSATTFCTDIRKMSIDSLTKESPEPQVIVGGVPCQGFSSIRPFRTLTENDPRNNLFEQFALFIKVLRPKFFVFENVVGLLTHKKGQTFRVILDTFEGIGYKVEWKVLNAALYGLPQRRERLVIVGNSLGQSFKWKEPTHYFNGRSMAGKKYSQIDEQLPLFAVNLLPAISVMEAIHDLPKLETGESSDNYREDVIPTRYEKTMRGTEKILTLHQATNHTARMLEIIRKAGYNRDALPEGLTSSGFSSCYSRLEPDIPSVTITVNFVHPASNKCIHPYQDRALTPREGARLQGFEDRYKFKGNRSQIVKQIGNAVPPVLGQVIAESVLEHL
jgi:DNA (cytosine-5)-methyltransferase 1